MGTLETGIDANLEPENTSQSDFETWYSRHYQISKQNRKKRVRFHKH